MTRDLQLVTYKSQLTTHDSRVATRESRLISSSFIIIEQPVSIGVTSTNLQIHARIHHQYRR